MIILSDKKLHEYKSEVVYNTRDNRAVDIKIHFDPFAGNPKLDVHIYGNLSAEETDEVIVSIAKNLKYRMAYEIDDSTDLNIIFVEE